MFRRHFSSIEFFPVILGALLLGLAAWQNMYPLVYSDTGTYIVSGLNGVVPNDRPLLYGLFLRHTSMRTTMWLSLIAQLLIVSSVLFAFVKSMFTDLKYRSIFYGLTTILVFFTAISIKTSTLIPDAFTPLVILCSVILWKRPSSILLRIWFSVIMIFCLSVHHSHMIILLLALLLFALYAWIHLRKPMLHELRRAIFFMPVLVSSLLLTPTINYVFSGDFYSNRSGGIFTIGRIADTGVLEEYLKENCDRLPYEICQYKDELRLDFLWNDKSPLYKMGGWQQPRDEYEAIVFDIITTPKYFARLAAKIFPDMIVQFCSFGIDRFPENAQYGVDTAPYYALRDVYSSELPHYLASNQNTGRLHYGSINARQEFFAVILLLMFIAVMASSARKFLQPMKNLLLLIFFYTISNAVVCAAFSIPNPRYQTRVFWLLPLIFMMTIIKIWTGHRAELKQWFRF